MNYQQDKKDVDDDKNIEQEEKHDILGGIPDESSSSVVEMSKEPTLREVYLFKSLNAFL